ncbi:MAG: hypothetical protein HY093_03665 [Candidatus Liptonbacteria bacterium]|nr:hypothetical protein [Candidatus Liptonbacteria bacterium]
MTFRVKSGNENLQNAMRKIGYNPIDMTDRGEMNCVRSLMGGDYPRFHVYSKEEGNEIVINLHLDQKKPSYSGTHAHAGDYDSETVRDEAVRIKSALK